jgi:dephospho-CoA kinase
MEKPFIIAVVAEKGAGKGLFVRIVQRLLPEKNIVAVRFSDIWRSILHTLAREESRENISNLATAIRALFHDDGILVGAMQKRIAETDADIIILDGLRKEEELDPLVRKHGGLLVYIAASPEMRYARRREHAETTDERGMSWEQFMHQEGLAPEVTIRHIGETMADAVIENNGSVEEFEKKIRGFLDAQVSTRISP